MPTYNGNIAETLPWQDYADKSAMLDAMDDQVEWRSTLYPASLSALSLVGPLTNNAPIDFYHWELDGYCDWTGLEWWQQCMTLFMRHI